MTRALAAALLLALVAGCGYGPPPGEKTAQLFLGSRPDEARAELDSTEGQRRRWAIIRLARCGNPADAPRLAGALDPAREPVPLNRATAAGALRILGNPVAVPALIQALRDPDPTVRAEALRALGTLQARSERPAIERALRADPAPSARVEAAYALRRLADLEALPALALALEDPDESVVFAAHDALQQISGAQRPPHRRHWEAPSPRP